ncbi:MAG TPA: TolC family protein [Acidobacteriaceae bacterium]|nr:TolC family protein [Acidobacteriaceae bacterium]
MHKNRLTVVLASASLLVTPTGFAQSVLKGLPSAPRAQLALQMQTAAPAPAATPPPSPTQGGAATAGTPDLLTRTQAEQLALKNNPHISVAALLALAQKQVVRETRSFELPNLNGNITGVDSEEASRISSGSLSASRLLYHVGAGVQLSQLITDFGRTHNLVASSSLQSQAADEASQATRADIVLATDLAFYRALEAQATLTVAQGTVAARQNVRDQVAALTASKLKSTLDQSFAEVNLSQAKLLVLDAQNQLDAAMAALNEVLGTTNNTQFRLEEDAIPAAPIAPSADAVVAMALQQRPDLLAQRYTHDANVSFAKAQRDQLFPTISGLGVVGTTPVGSNEYFPQNWYGAVGINIGIPLFNGFRYHAEASAADLRARASAEQDRALEDRIVRDVRTAWLTMASAEQRMTVTAQLLRQANTALDLAQTRYNLGLSSIVELSQAQLQQTQAQIDQANARLDFEADLAALRFQSGAQP